MKVFVVVRFEPDEPLEGLALARVLYPEGKLSEPDKRDGSRTFSFQVSRSADLARVLVDALGPGE